MLKILLSGASGVVGRPLSERLRDQQIIFKTVSRKSVSDNLQWDLHEAAPDSIVAELTTFAPDTLIHCAPIWLLPQHLETLKKTGIKRIVAFSSSSVSSKEDSKDKSEHQLVHKLSSAERSITKYCAQQGIKLTLFRPTLIYGHQRDQNICHIANFIGKYRFFLLVGKGKGLRQPVHADDLVAASMAVLDRSQTFGKTYYLGGAEVLSYHAMVMRIFKGMNRKPRVISVPLNLFRLALKIAAIFGRFSYTPDMANRMQQNLNYDISPAQTDFNYAPQLFLTLPQRDLPPTPL